MSIGVWARQGVVIPQVSSDTPGQPCVIYETGAVILSGTVFKMWFSTGAGLCYAESSDGVTFTRYTSNPVIGGIGHSFASVFKNASTYYAYCNGGGGINVYTSADGITWVSAATGQLPPSQAWETGAATFYGQLKVMAVVTGTWYGYYTSYITPSDVYAMGLATSSDGINWTKYAGNPVVTAEGPSNFFGLQVGSAYYGWSQIVQPGIPAKGSLGLPSDITRFNATLPSGPWNAITTNSTFYRTVAGSTPNNGSDGIDSVNGQVADPYLIEVGGAVYMYYTISYNSDIQQYAICCAKASMTMAQLVQTNEGIVNIPIPTVAGLAYNLTVAATDNFTRANANPIGGNWSTGGGGFGANQIVSNKAECASAGVNSVSYWNGLTWGNDQWVSTTLAALAAASNAGAALRISASAKTAYLIYANGALGSPVAVQIAKFVAGTFTSITNASSVVNAAASDVITGVVIGTQLSAYYNGALICIATDSAIASGNAGMILNGISSVGNAAISAWSGGNFAHSIGGNAGVAGATITYTGTTSGSTTADLAGNYTLPGLIDGSYTITPSKTGYTFSPVNSAQTVAGADITGVNFTATMSSGSGSWTQGFRNFINKR